jgi:hypothetical protein
MLATIATDGQYPLGRAPRYAAERQLRSRVLVSVELRILSRERLARLRVAEPERGVDGEHERRAEPMVRKGPQIPHQSERIVDFRRAGRPRMLVLLDVAQDRQPPRRSPIGLRCRPLRLREQATIHARSFGE